MITRSEFLSFTFIEARKATPSGSYGAALVRMEVSKAETGTQNWGKYLCSQTCKAEVVSKRYVPLKRARTRRGVASTFTGPVVTRVAANFSRLWRRQKA